ncbi:hypothetical protein [Gulosibacter hominis]|uniref:hypothetical protein n=1 Tax=Gulosibacter hominis TaxID=2770504 RepID=UPI001918A31C|nr:hypothetical protein [Gulosibacter hominis]
MKLISVHLLDAIVRVCHSRLGWLLGARRELIELHPDTPWGIIARRFGCDEKEM